MRKSIGLLILVLILFGNSFAQTKRLMTFIDMLEIPVLSDIHLSSSGKQILYSLSKADWGKNRRIQHIWRTNTDGSENIQLTNGLKGEGSPRWSPDDQYIAFAAKRGEDQFSQIFLIFNQGGEAFQLTEHATSVSSIQWSPDGSSIYFTATDEKPKMEKERKKTKDDVYAFDEDYQHRHLWNITIADKEEKQITSGNFSVLGYHLSLDGKKIVHQRSESPLLGERDKSEIWIMDNDGCHPLRLTHNSISEENVRLSPDNRQVLFISWCNEKFELYYNNNLFIIATDGGTARLLLKDLPYEIQRASWSNDGNSIYFIANMGTHTELFKVNVSTEEFVQLTNGQHSLRSWTYHPHLNTHIYSINEQTNAGDIWMLSNEKNTKPKRITHVFDYLSASFLIPQQEAIQWKGNDSVTVEGIVHYPLNYEKGKKYPLVVQTHGGPRSSDKFGFGWWRAYIPVLAAKGYAVLRPNYRGSTGYGDDFLRDMVGSYFGQSHLDVLAGVDHLIEIGLADGDKLIKAGWSAGGHMTNKIITFTDRFKAASSGAGAVNWISMYSQSDTRIQRTPWFGGTPWQENAPIDVYWDSSPLKDIWKVKTPTIIFVGKNDPRVPMPQSVELYRALKSNGVPTKLYVAPREEHGWRELRHELFKMNAELDWFETYVMEREYTWEKVPENKKNTNEE